MMNKKGISIGRILLYILFLTLIGIFIYTLVITFNEIRKKEDTSSIQNVIRKVDASEPIRNMYNKDAYPFQNKDYIGVSSSNRCFTGFYIYVNAGTYSITTDLNLSSYKYGVMVINTQPWFISGISSTSFDSPWYTSNTTTFTLNQPGYISLVVAAANGTSNISANTINNFNFMLVEGDAQAYVAYNNSFVNALDYVSDAYFTAIYQTQQYDSDAGYLHWYQFGYIPTSYITDNIYGDITGQKHTYNKSIINRNDLLIGDNISSLYSDINNQTFNWSHSYFPAQNNLIYNNCVSGIAVYYDCSVPIPVNYFNFSYLGFDTLARTSCMLVLSCNDNIELYLPFDNTMAFNYQSILNSNPYVTSINSFGFYIYTSNDFYHSSYDSSYVGLQDDTWSNYIDYCSFHLIFDNIYGDVEWQNGYDEGFRAGKNAVDEGLYNSNISLKNDVDELTSQVNDLSSRVNTQSGIIDSLNNQLQNSGNNFKGLFFTFADIPFKTVSNALGFEFWGVNLFKFFVGVITALGLVWLIKKFI